MIGFLKRRNSSETPSGLSRRGFLQVAAVGIGGAAIFAAGAGPSWLTRKFSGVVNPNRSDFASQLGKEFKVRKSALEEVNLELTKLSDIATGSTASPEENFSAIFRGPNDNRLEQDTYTVENSAIGTFALFIVPIYNDGDDLRYEAVFNRTRA